MNIQKGKRPKLFVYDIMNKRKAYKTVTLKDVAAHANVSQTTVSRVINNPQIVDAETRETILTAMHELGYVPSKKSSASQQDPYITKKKTIALMIPNDENPFYQVMITYCEKYLSAAGYLMLLCVYNNDYSDIEIHLRNLMDQNISGCIMSYMKTDSNSQLIKEFTKRIPSVSFQTNIDFVDSVEADEENGCYEMLNRLLQYGHRKIGFVGYFSNMNAYEKRLGAYKKVHEENNLPIQQEYISEYVGYTGMDFNTSYREGCRLLSLPDRPTAIYCFNLKVAMGVYAAIRDYKLKIPEDISLVGVDDLQIAQLFTPPLTVVGIPLESMLSTAIDFLKQRIDNKINLPYQHVVFPTSLHLRPSIGPAPSLLQNNEKIIPVRDKILA